MLYNQPYGMPPETTWGDTPYINGDPSVGRAGSIPPAASIEYPQREIVNVIRDAGLVTPSNSDLHQLSKSIQSTLLYSDDDAGTTNQYQVTQTPAPTAYFKYMTVVAKIGNTNTGASTLNVNALGAKPIRHPADNSELSAGELRVNAIACFVYDGSYFHLVWSSSGQVQAGGPIYLIANRTFYVNGSTGDDTNYDGSAATFSSPNHGPFKTLQRAANEVIRYNMNGFNLSISVAVASGYSNTVSPLFRVPGGAGTLILSGSGGSPVVNGSSCSAIQVEGPGSFNVSNFKFTSSGANVADPCCGIFTAYGYCGMQNIEFGACSGPHMDVSRSSSMTMSGNLTLSGSSSGNAYATSGHINCFFSATIETAPAISALYLSATAAINVGNYIWSTQLGVIDYTWTSYSGFGNVSGVRYSATLNGVINTGGGGVNYYPGTIAGSI